MKDFDFKKLLPHLIVGAVFLAIILVYFSPVLKGYKLKQGDIKNFKGMSKEIFDYREKTGDEALWTNSMFAGMPAYLVSFKKKGNLVNYIDKALSLGMDPPVKQLFLYLIGFYILLLSLKIDQLPSAIGAFAFAFSSYFFIILEAGHNTKGIAIAYMAPILAGFILAYRGKYLMGAAITALFFALELKANHLQITYYLGIVLAIYGAFKLVESIREKQLPAFTKSTLYLLVAIVLAIGPNISGLWAVYEYGKYSTRGKSELTILNNKNQTSGLDKDYATAWSYGVGETFTLLVPGFKGGESAGIASDPELLEDAPAQYKQLLGYAQKYHGDQPFTSGPVYVGAIVCFLFVLGLFFLNGPLKWAMLLAAVLSIMLAWGKNFMPLTDFFLDLVPGYNKFRAVSMILIIAELAIPVLAFLALDKVLKSAEEIKKNIKKLYIALGVVGGLALLIAIMPTSFTDFSNPNGDAMLGQQLQEQAGMPAAQISGFFEQVEEIRKGIVTSDAWRSFFLVILSGSVLWLFVQGKVKKNILLWSLAILVFFDMWSVNKRYLNNEKNEGKYIQWESKIANDQPYQLSQADEQILLDKDPHYRVWNTTTRLDQDGRTPYFHKSIGGYHGAKMKRFQELVDLHLNKQNMKAFDMLNTKYIIIKGQQGGLQAQQNPNALGNAWFVNEVVMAASADEEITKLNDIDPATQCIVDQRFKDQVSGIEQGGTVGSIKLDSYDPKELVYSSNSQKEGVAVFSEMYYAEGWNAYIDGELVPHFRCNYVLRGLKIPAGEHKVEFKFEPAVYVVGEKLSLAFSILLIVGVLGAGYRELNGSSDSA
ncbi:MAG: hypothetical protein JKY42_02615 [Flavobacteriales bacterium]|nr:hypothetical protein [Flavobacteriales bacterium]